MRPHFHKLQTQILISGILLFAGLVVFVGITTYKREQVTIREYSHARMKSLILDLEIKIVSIESVLETESHKQDFTPSDSSALYARLRKFVSDNDFVSNMALDYYDGASLQGGSTVSSTFYVARDSLGSIVHGVVSVPTAEVNRKEMQCYNEAWLTGEPCWSQPYRDDNISGHYVFTCYQKGEKDGVMFSSDVQMAKILRSIEDLQFYENSSLYVVDGDGDVYSLSDDSRGHGGILVSRASALPSDRDFITIKAHYDNLNLDIINIVPKEQIYSFMWSGIFVVFMICILGLTLLAFLVHRTFTRAQDDLARSLRVSAEEEMALKKIEGELAVAYRIQKRMLTDPGRGVHLSCPGGGEADVFSHIVPARDVGGDFYEYRLEGNNLVFCIADVSGKGIPASVVMTMCCTLFHAYVSELNASDPAGLLSYFNNQLCRRNRDSMFVTMWAGVLDLTTGRLRYSSAAHNAPVILGGEEVSFLEKCQGLPLGLFEDSTYMVSECGLAAGSTLLLYTDGITEAEAPDLSLFGEGGLLEACRGAVSRRPEDLCNSVLRSVRNHAAGAPQSDAITLLCVQFGAEGGEEVTPSSSGS